MTDSPKRTRAATSTTRRGNGAGYGGPAKGGGSGAVKQDFSNVTNAQGHNGVTAADEGNRAAMRREQAEALNDVLLRIAHDDTRGPSQVKAIETFQNRQWGTPKATMALEGDGKKPLFVFMGVPEKESSEEWAKGNAPD